MIKGMSCSMRSTDAASSCWMVDDQRAEGLRLALGQTRRSVRRGTAPWRRGPADRPARPPVGCRSRGRDVVVPIAAQAEESTRSRHLGHGRRGSGVGPRAGPARVESMPGSLFASRATRSVSFTVSSGKSVADWNVRPSPSRGPVARRLVRRPPRRRGAPNPRRRRSHRSAFIRVDLPAPLLPMSPTISPALHVERRRLSTAAMPPKCHAELRDGEHRDRRSPGARLGRPAHLAG